MKVCMNSLSLFLLALSAALLPAGGVLAGESSVEGRRFVLPDGFVIERVAGPPLVDRPIVAAFDEAGRLYVADSSGSSDPVQKQLAEKPHRILRLEDRDGDGRFDHRTVFADRMMFPEGAMWLGGSLYVAAPPSIWKLTDADGDGIAERRSEWFQGKTLTGCANDLHGPYPGLDGWIYWCKGAFAEQTYERPGRSPFVTRASHIFRCRPDGSGIEPVMTGGMDNPVDVVFTPGGERILSCTFLQNPEGGRRDGLIHTIYGGVYGKVHEVIDGHPRTRPDVMPPLTHLGPAAPCGLASYESDAFGAGYRNSLFATLFNLQKVTRHVLEPRGATFVTRDEDFLVSPDRDFHPTDVVPDADGSLLVIDTGGWYKLCCPTSQLGKPDVLGAIYRIRRANAARPADPRGLELDWASLSAAELAKLLDDPRPAVRERTLNTLGQRGAAALPVLESVIRTSKSAESRRNAVWAATRIDDERSLALVRSALKDDDETVRQAALHSVSVRRDRAALEPLAELLKGPSLQNRRAAAEALGRMGDKSSVLRLLKAADGSSDPILDHSLTYALIEIADPRAVAIGLADPSPKVRRAALVALDQMEGGELDPGEVAKGLASADAAVRDTASWIIGRHPKWGGVLLDVLRNRLSATNLTGAETTELGRQLARFASTKPIQDLLAAGLLDSTSSVKQRHLVLGAMAESGLKEMPRAWVDGLTAVLNSGDPNLLPDALATARAFPLTQARAPALYEALRKLAENPKLSEETRLEALAAMPGGKLIGPLFDFLRQQLEPDRPVVVRRTAADVLAKASLVPEQLGALTASVKTAGPLEVDKLLVAFERSTDDELGLRLVSSLKESTGVSSLRAETLKPHLAKFSERVRREAESLYRQLDIDATKQRARLETLVSTLKGGDIRRGQSVFNSTKAACSSCHAIGYLGGRVGPDLTRIGQIRTERDLLEAIVFPSISFVRSFEPVVVATREGKVYNGVARKDAPDEVILSTGPNEEARIARGDIEEMRPGTVSIMPAGLDQQLTPADLADLVAFLKACK